MPHPAARAARHSWDPHYRVHRGRLAAAALGVLTLLLTGCGESAPPGPVLSASPSGTATSQPTLQPFYDQTVAWSACGDFACATVTVPIDYAEPAAGSIELAIKGAPARSGAPIGSLLIDPGGPGSSGVGLVDQAVQMFGDDVLDTYDVVGFDPRGVGASNPVTCQDNAAKDSLLSKDFDYATDAGIADGEAAYAAMGTACAAKTGPLLAHVDTVSAAKDMDILRAALGDEKLAYLGFSYGTLLGATYAGLFPERVGRMVLDGAVDPSLSDSERVLDQAVGFEGALRAYVMDCQDGLDCPLTGTVDEGLAQIHDLIESAQRSPLPTESGRVVTGTLAFYGVLTTLYSEGAWGQLTQALTAALDGTDATMLLQLADHYNDRNPDGSFTSNSTEAFTAINCLDSASSSDPAVMRGEAAKIVAVAPTLGYRIGFGGVNCAGWPYRPTGRPGPISADGAPPIVVIGTTNDPATPYKWAQSLASELSSGVLLTYEGEGHTAYGRSNECIMNAVDAYLVAGTVPADGTRC